MLGLGYLIAVTLEVASVFSDFEIRERTGDYFLSTRTPLGQSYGMRFFDLGYAWAPTVVAPLVLCPVGYVAAAADKFVLSPLWDVLNLPYDAMTERPPQPPRE